MIPIALDYATPSVFESSRERALLGLSADLARPVRFHAKVSSNVLMLRLALQALGELVWRNDEWRSEEDNWFFLDPIVTVHPDRVFFEAFSGDQSAYGLVIADRALFAPIGKVEHGTTNVDFTAWLWAALAEMRSSRETFFRVGPEGFEVATADAGGRFEQKVDVPDDWVRGFLQLQGAMALPGTRFSVRPVDLLAAIRFLRVTKAKVSPRALRYELEPGEDAKIVLEPWEHAIRLRGAEHSYSEKRVIRTWGRRRLSLLEPLLPYAERVDIYLKGRALPSFYAVKLPGITFVVGLSGWTSQRWTATASFDLLVTPVDDPAAKTRVLDVLRESYHVSSAELAAKLALDAATATGLLSGLCAEGRCIYDVETRRYRYRELFAKPIDLALVYPPDKRREAATAHLAAKRVEISTAAPRETRKQRRFKNPETGEAMFREVILRDWVVQGRVAEQTDVELVLSDEDRLIFGRCGCTFFRDNLLAQGPCEHLLALLLLAQPQRKDTASSVAVDKEAFTAQRPPRAEPGDDEVDADEESDDDA